MCIENDNSKAEIYLKEVENRIRLEREKHSSVLSIQLKEQQATDDDSIEQITHDYYDKLLDSIPEEQEKAAVKYNSSNFYQGLSAIDIYLLSIAGKYHTDEDKFPGYFRYWFRLRKPKQHFDKLIKKGYLREAEVEESISAETVNRIKEVLRRYDLPISGKKTDLTDRLLRNLNHEELSKEFPRRLYALTPEGEKLEQSMPYIRMVMDSDDLQYLKFSVWDAARAMADDPTGPYADRLISAFCNHMVKFGTVIYFDKNIKEAFIRIIQLFEGEVT